MNTSYSLSRSRSPRSTRSIGLGKTVLATSLAFGLLGAAETAYAACPGTLGDFAHRTPVTVTNAGANAIANGYVVVTLDHASLVGANKAKADGGDLRFADAQCNALDFWVDHGLGTAAAKVWVKVPSVEPGANTILAYYGAPEATRTNDPATLFGANLLALYPMTEGEGAIAHDRVGGFDLDLSAGAVWAAGPRQGTFSVTGFTDGGRLMRTATNPDLGTGDFATFAVINPKAANGSTQGVFGNYTNDGASGWTLKLQGGAGQAMLLTNQGGNWCQQSAGNLVSDAWQTLGAERQGGEHRIFVNGAGFGPACAGDTRNVTNATAPFEIGRSYNGSYAFNGNVAFTSLYSVGKTDEEMLALHTSLALGADLALANGAEMGRAGAPTLTKTTRADEEVTFEFSAPAATGGATITGYVVSCNGGEVTVAGAASPLKLGGLDIDVTYTCSVHAVTEFGQGAASETVVIGPVDVPGAPTNPAVKVNGTSASMSFTAPADTGGSPITGYVTKCQAGALSKEGASSPIALGTLTPGSYTCMVAAKNAHGTGPESAAVKFTIAVPAPTPPSTGDTQTTPPSKTPTSATLPQGGTGSSAGEDASGAACGCKVVDAPTRGGTFAALGLLGAIGAVLLRRRSSKASNKG